MRLASIIRAMGANDPHFMGLAFAEIGKREERFEQYLEEQRAGLRHAFVAWVGEQCAGYVTICWQPTYEPLAREGIPEVQDLNVLPAFRRRGIGTHLVDEAEWKASQRSDRVGIGVGLHPGYNAAQRMYVLRGYVPDGHGITVRDVFVQEGQKVTMNDDVVLHFVKELNSRQ